MGDWYSRPVFFVESVARAAAFYIDKLGFAEGPRYTDNGIALIGEVKRGDCAILLNCQQPEKRGRGRMFISLDKGDFAALKAEFAARGAPSRDGWWGSDILIVEDPDGNELFFPYP